MNSTCPECDRSYLYADQQRGGTLFVHGFDHAGEPGDLVKDACWSSGETGRAREQKPGRSDAGGDLQEAEFYLDMLPEKTFRGYTAGITWNGWACSLFERDEAMRIAEAFDGLTHPYDGSKYPADYDEDTDRFAFYSPTRGVRDLRRRRT